MSSITSHIFCTKCGTQAPSDFLFCTKCGSHLVKPDAAFIEMTSTPQVPSQASEPTEGGALAISPRAIIQAIADKISGLKPRNKTILGCCIPYFLWAKPFDSISRQIKKRIIIGWVLVIAFSGIASIVGDYLEEKGFEKRLEQMSPEDRERVREVHEWANGVRDQSR